MAHEHTTFRWLAVAALGLGSLTAVGCYAEARTRPAYVEAEYVPPHIDVYPRYHHEGRVVYLVNDRWYYREGPRWVYYRSEPVVLQRRRAQIHRAPPAPDRRTQIRRAPRARDRYEDRREHRRAPPHAEGRRRDRY